MLFQTSLNDLADGFYGDRRFIHNTREIFTWNDHEINRLASCENISNRFDAEEEPNIDKKLIRPAARKDGFFAALFL